MATAKHVHAKKFSTGRFFATRHEDTMWSGWHGPHPTEESAREAASEAPPAPPDVVPEPIYLVKNGHTLGYVQPEAPNSFNVLHGSPLLGGHDWKNGPVAFGPSDKLVPATLDDFKRFRVSPPPGLFTPAVAP